MSNRFEGGEGSLQQVLPLGTGAVTTQTKIVGSIPKHARVTGIRFYGQAAPTATALTAEVFARTKAGATGLTLQDAATDIDFGTAAAAKAGGAAVLATEPNTRVLEDQLIEVVVTADTCSAGPGDLLVEVEYKPHYNRG
jgi:hypothetical protein